MEWLIVVLVVVVGLGALAWRYPDQMQRAGDNMQRLGCGLTLLVTLPIVGLFVFGILGLIIGGIIGLLFGVGMVGSAFAKEPEEHRCPACHAVVAEGEEFCGKCGSRFTASELEG